MIALRRYEYDDEKKIEPVEPILLSHPDRDRLWRSLVMPEFTWTGYQQDRIVGVGGLIPSEFEDAYAWVIIDKNLKPLGLVKCMKLAIRLAESFRFPVLYTYIQNKFDRGCRLATFLGFERICEENGMWLYRKVV